MHVRGRSSLEAALALVVAAAYYECADARRLLKRMQLSGSSGALYRSKRAILNSMTLFLRQIDRRQ